MAGISELVEKASVVSSEETLSKTLSLIKQTPLHSVVVSQDGKTVFGVIDDRCLLDFHENPEKTKCGHVSEKTAVADDSTTPEQLVMHFLDTNARIIPFEGKDKKVQGGISRISALKLLLPASAIKQKSVREFMSSPGAVIGESASVQQARKKMRELGVFHLCVTDSAGRMEGVISSYDIAAKVIPHQRESHRESTFAPQAERGVEMEAVSTVMSSVYALATPSTPLKQAIGEMIEKNVAALAVVEGDRPVGLLSVRDCMHAVLKPASEPVLVYGLREDEKSMAESIKQLGAEFMAKLDKKLTADYLAIHVKSFKEGKKRRYAVKGKLSVKGRLYSVSTPETSAHRNVWDLHLSVKEILEELSRVASDREHSQFRSRERSSEEEE